MPGSVQNAAPSTVLPLSLSRAFVHSREHAVLANDYPNGQSQRSVFTTFSRKRWKLTKRPTPAQLSALRDFYDARKGGLEPFYFHDPWDTSPKFSYDPTGVATTGRYTVRFEGTWEQSVDLGRTEVSIELVELA